MGGPGEDTRHGPEGVFGTEIREADGSESNPILWVEPHVAGPELNPMSTTYAPVQPLFSFPEEQVGGETRYAGSSCGYWSPQRSRCASMRRSSSRDAEGGHFGLSRRSSRRHSMTWAASNW